MSDEKRLLWLGDRLVPAEEAKINVLSPCTQYGITVFEGVRAYLDTTKSQLNAFRIHDHLDRLFESAHSIGLTSEHSKTEILEIVRQTVRANGYQEDISIRIVLLIDNSSSWAYEGPCSLLVAPIAKGRAYDKPGITVGVSSWERIHDRCMPPRTKVGANYLNSRLAQLEAKDHGYDTALLLNREGGLAESPGACAFLVKKGVLLTPPTSASILNSITRDTLLRLASDLGIPTEVRPIDRAELSLCDEMFLCGSAVEIVPVLQVNSKEIGRGVPGETTQKLTEAYFRKLRSFDGKYPDWLYPLNVE